jgi:ankyrin repeat protein
MKSFKQFLIEARRNPELNPKINLLDIIKKYKDDPDVYISYRSIDKIGINPMSKFNTPNGIYTYPLKEIYDKIYNNIEDVPFAGKEPYIYVIKLKSQYKKSFINDLYTEYDSKMFDNDMIKLRKTFINNVNQNRGDWTYTEEKFNDIIENASRHATIKNPSGIMWNITRMLSKQNPNAWNHTLRVVLGYSGMADKTGNGIIHTAEPIQAVFFDIKSFDVIDIIHNFKQMDKKRRDIFNVFYDSYDDETILSKVEKYMKIYGNRNIKDENGNTLLHTACKLDGNLTFEYLLKSGIKPNAKNNIGNTPLLILSNLYSQYKKINMLLKYGADVNAKNKYNKYPLHYASENGESNVIEILLNNGANVNVKDNNGNTPLMLSILDMSVQCTKLLLEAGADPNIQNSFEKTALHLISNSPLIVKLLLQYKANPNIRDVDGRTPIFKAVSTENEEIIEMFLKGGADPNIKDDQNKTVLYHINKMHYISSNNKKIIDLLKKYGATE